VFETESNLGVSDDGTIMYRESYKKLSGSSIISPFEYSLSINDTYSLYLSYRLNYRESYEEKFTIDYSTNDLNFYYMDGDFAQYVSEFSEQSVFIYYYDEFGKQQIMDKSDYKVDTNLHRVTLKDNENTLVTPNSISEFYVSYAASPLDYQVLTHKYSYYYLNNLTISDTLEVTDWDVLNGEKHDVIPNFNAYYYDQMLQGVPYYVGGASQLSAFLEPNEELVYELYSALDFSIYDEIKLGEYSSLYMNTVFDNYESLDTLTVKLYNLGGIMENFTQIFTLDDLLRWNFNLKIDLPTTTNTLLKIHIIPEFRSDKEYSYNNYIGVPKLEFSEWSSDIHGEPLLVMDHMLEDTLYINLSSPLETFYLYNEKLQYLALPEGDSITWTVEQDPFGQDIYIIHIPNTYLDPNNKSNTKTFKDGDKILIRYNSPVEKAVGIGIEKLYFNKKPYDHIKPPSFAELKLINTEDANNYSTYSAPYSYNITLPLTPFNTEHLGSYMDTLININLTTLQQFAVNGYIDFSHLVLAVPNPGYELTLHEIAIIQESVQPSGAFESVYDRVWRYTERENFTSSPTPITDEYDPLLLGTPLFYNDPDQGRWLDYLRIYDDNYNYYSAGFSGIDNQLLYNPTTGNFTWNGAFSKSAEYWGMDIELPALIAPNTTLYFEYCTNNSWSTDFTLHYENIDIDSLDLILNFDYLLDPHYETWYDEIIRNSDYDFDTVQFYSESFKVYNNSDTASYTFETIFDFTVDFLNLSFYEVVATYPNFTFNVLKNDSVNYNIDFDKSSKKITITDLIAEDGRLNQFDDIVIVLNFTSGPISDKTKISLSSYFNQTYLVDISPTFYDYLIFDFERNSYDPILLFVEDSQTIISDYTSFESIDYTSNVHLGSEQHLRDFNTSLSFTNFKKFSNPYNTIYEADIDFDGEVDYKQEIDIEKDGTIDITRYGIADPEVEGELLWYRIIQDFNSEEKTRYTQYDPILMTDWFNLDTEAADLTTPHVYARRTTQELTNRFQTTKIKSYSITLDNDLDGYADSYVEYKKVIDIVNTQIDTVEMTALVDLSGSTYSVIFGDSDVRKYILNRELTPYIIENDKYSQLTYGFLFDENLKGEIKLSYTKIGEVINFETTDQTIQETITYTDFEEGEPVSVRTYVDSFPTETYRGLGSEYNEAIGLVEDEDYAAEIISMSEQAYLDGRINSLYTLSEENQQVEINTLPFLITDPQQLNWSAETWGVDSVPLQFDTVYTNTFNGEIDTYNIYESEIKINIKNRYSLYHDYLKEKDSLFRGDTIFIANGVFITPKDGLVYYTSDKYAFSSQDHRKAKTEGHYFYYDSDQNGFYETVYVLAPDINSDGIYDVVSIGYNYDGKHEFMPYTLADSRTLYTDTYTSHTYTSQVVYEGTVYHKFEIYTSYFMDLLGFDSSVLMNLLDNSFPTPQKDSFIPRDSIFEIARLMPISGLNEYIPSLYYQVYSDMYAASWAVFNDGLWRDTMEQVGMITVAGILSSAAFIGITSVISSTGIGALIAATVFAIVYFIESTVLSDAKKRIAKAKETAQTYYRVDIQRRNDQDVSEVSLGYDDAWEHVERHPSAKYVPVSGGEPGQRYTAQAIVTPPKNLRFSANALADTDFSKMIHAYMEMVENDQMPITELVSRLSETQRMIKVGGATTYTNLDFLLVASELPSYNTKEHYQFSFGEDNDRTKVYLDYPQNTLGYLDQEVETESNGLYDTIRPYNINGRPSYIFINSSDNLLTLPASALYQPIVISKERYIELAGIAKIPDGTISVDIKSKYFSPSTTQGIDTTELTYAEGEQGYKAKVPLFADEFKYPISIITLDVVAIKELTVLEILGSEEYLRMYLEQYGDFPTFGLVAVLDMIVPLEYTLVSEIEINPQDYIIEGNNLYFYTSLDSIVIDIFDIFQINIIKALTFIGVFDKLLYRINIDIPLVIPDTEAEQEETITYFYPAPGDGGGDDYIFPGDGGDFSVHLYVEETETRQITYTTEILDATTSDLAKAALIQATTYLISDYFNIFTIAEKVARSQAEQDYTAKVTALSTLISSLVMLPITVLTAGANAAITQGTATISRVLTLTAVKYIAQIGFMVATEVFEELYIDTWIERWVTNLVKSMGGNAEATEFWTSFVCSFREVAIGAVSTALGGFRAPKIGPDLDIQQSFNQLVSDMSSEQSSSQLQQDQEALTAISEEIDRKLKQLQEKSSILSKMKTLLFKVGEIFMASHSFFAGSAGLFSIGFFGDIATDFYFDTHLQNVQKKKQIESLTQFKTQLGKISNDLNRRLLIAQSVGFSNLPQLKSIHTINPTLNPYQALTQVSQLRAQSEALAFNLETNLAISRAVNAYKIGTKKITEENMQKLKDLENTDNTLEPIQEIAMIQVDPDYLALVEEEEYVRKPEKIGALINAKHDIPTAKRRIKASLFINRKTNVFVVYRGQLVEIGATIKYYDVKGKLTRYIIKKSDSLKDMLERLGYVFTKHKSPDFIFIIPKNKMINPTFNYYLETLGRNFEGSGNIIAGFANPDGFKALVKFQEDVVKPMREQMKLQFSLENNKIIDVFEGFLKAKLESSAVKAMWEKYSIKIGSKTRKEFNKQALEYFKKAFVPSAFRAINNGEMESLIDIRLDEVILQYLMRGPMNTLTTSPENLAEKFDQFRLEFTSGGMSLVKLEVTFDLLLSSSGFNQFMQSFLQSFYSYSLPSTGLNHNTNAKAFIGEIPEAWIMSEVAFAAMIEAWAESGFSSDSAGKVFEIYHAIDFTVRGKQTGLNSGDFHALIGGHNNLRDIKKQDNSGIDIYNAKFPLKQNIFDVLVSVFKGAIVSFESKHLRTSELDYILNYIYNIGVDQLRTIQPEKYLHIYEGENNIRKKFEYFTIPVSVEKSQDLLIWYEIFGMTDPSLLRHKTDFNTGGAGDYKGDVENLFNLEVTKLLNKYIFNYIQISATPPSRSEVKLFVSELLAYMYTDPVFFQYQIQFSEEVHNLAKGIFRRDLDESFFKNAAQVFLRSLDTIIQDTKSGIRLIWKETLSFHLDSGLILKKNWLPQNIFVIDEDYKTSPKTVSQLEDNYFEKKNSPYIWVHRKDLKNGEITNGLMKVDLLNNKLPTSKDFIYNEGFYDSKSQQIISGAYICNEEGTFLLSRIGFIGGEFFARDAQWYKAGNTVQAFKEIVEMTIGGETYMVSKLKYWRASTKVTGNGITAFLQKVESFIIPINSYNPALLAPTVNMLTGSSSLADFPSMIYKPAFIFDPFFRTEPQSMYGSFTKEEFMKTFFTLFANDYYSGKSLHYAAKNLNVLNGRSLGSKSNIFLDGQDINDINNAINDLGFTEEELNQLIWKKFDSKKKVLTYRFKDSLGDFTKKRWLKLVYDKITSYTKDDGSVYSIQRDKLLDLSKRSDFAVIDDNSLSRNIEKFTEQEARMATEIMNSANDIFGSFTTRLMMAGMISYYGQINNFGITINSREIFDNKKFGKIIKNIGLISPYFRDDEVPSDFHDLAAREKVNGFLFALFFLDAHIYLEIEHVSNDIRQSYNTLTFPYGPLIALDGAGAITGDTKRDLSYDVASYFNTFSIAHFEKNFGRTETKPFVKLFETHQSSIVDYLIEKKIAPSISITGEYTTRGGFFESLIDEITYELKNDLLSFSTLKPLRSKLEKFSKDMTSSIKIELKAKDPFTGNKLFFELTKKDLVDMGLIEWGIFGSHFGQSLNIEIAIARTQEIELSIDKVVAYLDSIIQDEKLGKGKVILVPIVNTKNKDLGYKVLKRIDFGRRTYRYLPDSGVFKLDTNDDNYEVLLRHCAYLMLSGASGFVMKDWKENVGNLKDYLTTDTSFISAFTRERILEPGDIFSGSGYWRTATGYSALQIVANDYSQSSFRPDQDEWKALWTPYVWTRGSNTDLSSYLKNLLIEHPRVAFLLGYSLPSYQLF